MGTWPEAESYRAQHDRIMQSDRTKAHKFADQCLWAEATAEKLLDLINGAPATPTKDDIVALLLKTVVV